MKSAYLYCRVSTDEQKRKGNSLEEQEDRLTKHCDLYDIQIKGIYREDYSAKDFNRPEWKKLIKKIRRNIHRPSENIIFMKWDRFSRNIEYAYQMIRMLRDLNVQPMAIDQPIDLDVPESIVMLAVYLSIPEAENSRRGFTTADGLRRARKMGRWPRKAPIGYVNRTDYDGKKHIEPKQPEADLIKWSFEQLAKGTFTIAQVRRMACMKGLQCGKNNFWRLVHNPIYCGIIWIPANRNEERYFAKKDELKSLFPLRTFINCPWCGRKLTGSVSKGRHGGKYPYYRCTTYKCKGRFRADKLNDSYEEKLKKLYLRSEVNELFDLLLEDENIFTRQREYTDERKKIENDISKQQLLISKARKYFLDEKIDIDDFNNVKKEHYEILCQLNGQLESITEKIAKCDLNKNLWPDTSINIFRSFKDQDIKGKRDIISLFTPVSINPANGNIDSLKINEALFLIVKCRRTN